MMLIFRAAYSESTCTAVSGLRSTHAYAHGSPDVCRANSAQEMRDLAPVTRLLAPCNSDRERGSPAT